MHLKVRASALLVLGWGVEIGWGRHSLPHFEGSLTGVALPEHVRHRRLPAVNVDSSLLPVYVDPMQFSFYQDTPATQPSLFTAAAGSGGIAPAGGIGDIILGEQATYNISVYNNAVPLDTPLKVGVTWWVSAANATSAYAYLVKGSNCYATQQLAVLNLTSFSTLDNSTYVGVNASTSVTLGGIARNITVCFKNFGSVNFGGLTFFKAPKSLPTTPTAVAKVYPNQDPLTGCFDGAPVWESTNGEVRLNGKAFRIKGVNWFGFDTAVYNLNGLWATNLTVALDKFQALGINLLRLPITLDLAWNASIGVNVKSNACGFKDNQCVKGRNAINQLGMVMDESAKRGILIVLDMHNLDPGANALSEVWFNGNIWTADQYFKGWDYLIKTFKVKPNFVGVDLFNEPHFSATWGIGPKPGKPSTDFGAMAATNIQLWDANHPDYKGFYLVEGVQKNENVNSPLDPALQKNAWWGGQIAGIYRNGVETMFSGSNAANLTLRLIYSPHVYGPSVFNQTYFNRSAGYDFPTNMPAIWDAQLGFVERVSGGRAVVLGEWGGYYKGIDQILQDKLATYLVQNCINDAIWWSVNPNTERTGGIFNDDWQTFRTDKLALIATVQPFPSRFTQPITSTTWCVDFGSTNATQCIGGTTAPFASFI